MSVHQWFELYPEFQANPFFIAGESYAGIYVPTLAYKVMKGNSYFELCFRLNMCCYALLYIYYYHHFAGIDAGEKPVLNFKVCLSQKYFY